MESKPLLEGIKSKVNIRLVFSHLKDITKYKIVSYSKKFQKIFNLTLLNYKEKCFESLQKIDFLKYLSTKNDSNLSSYFFKDDANDNKILKKKFNRKIEKSKINKNKFNQIIDEFTELYFKKIFQDYKSKEEINKNILDNQLIVDIYSPFYKLLLKKDIFDKLFILRIPFPLIYNKGLLDKYEAEIDLLNEANPNFSNFYFEIDVKDKDIQDFNFFCGKFKKVRKLIIETPPFNYSFLLPHEILSCTNIKNNLVYLEIKGSGFVKQSNNFYKALNELKSLEELRLDGIYDFILQKKGLKYLYLSNCQDIIFNSNCFENMEIINLFRINSINTEEGNSDFINITKIKIPNLIKFKTSFTIENYSLIFDFNDCKKLKYFIHLDIHSFLSLGENLLEKVYIKDHNISKSFLDEINMIKKLIEIKTLKEVKLDISFITEETFEVIKGENLSVEKLIINLNNYFDFDSDEGLKQIILYGFQKIFPNLKEFQIYLNSTSFNKSCKLELSPNTDYKINKFKFSGSNKNDSIIIFYTAPLENLVDVEFACMGPNFKYEESFPLFDEKCNNIFKSLTRFKFVFRSLRRKEKYFLELKIIKNLIDNLDKMPNLETLIIKAACKVDEITYIKLIEKLLLSNIKNIVFDLNEINDVMDEYSEKDFENFHMGFDIKKFCKIKIKKLKKI